MSASKEGVLDLYRASHETRTVSWTVSVTIGVFAGACEWCKKLTPRPTDADVLEFVRAHKGQNFMHASDWSPPGWSFMWQEGPICDECTATVAAARAKRSAPS